MPNRFAFATSFVIILLHLKGMNLAFNEALANGYSSGSQISRVVTEGWMRTNMYCPVCGAPMLHQYTANKPVADFYCEECKSDFELKSKETHNGSIGSTIADGAYSTMIERITSLRNPNLFVLTYSSWTVNNLLVIPNHFFTPAIIIKRPPLKETARRAGWIGCNIRIDDVPSSGRIFIIKDGCPEDKGKVLEQFQRSMELRTERIESRGWLLDVLRCIDRIESKTFSLSEVYDFTDELKLRHPENNFVRDKIRQQLQVLRDKGYIKFTSRGYYQKI